jgi:hypothetical protein
MPFSVYLRVPTAALRVQTRNKSCTGFLAKQLDQVGIEEAVGRMSLFRDLCSKVSGKGRGSGLLLSADTLALMYRSVQLTNISKAANFQEVTWSSSGLEQTLLNNYKPNHIGLGTWLNDRVPVQQV